jgi:hypothetical protein
MGFVYMGFASNQEFHDYVTKFDVPWNEKNYLGEKVDNE